MKQQLQEILAVLLNAKPDGNGNYQECQEAAEAILDLLDKSLVAPSDLAVPRDDDKGYYFDGYNQAIADVRKVIKESN